MKGIFFLTETSELTLLPYNNFLIYWFVIARSSFEILNGENHLAWKQLFGLVW